MVKPVRIQRSRRKGSKLTSPNGLPVVCVSRGTKWGNPFKLSLVQDILGAFDCGETDARKRALEAFGGALRGGDLDVSVAEVRRELRGKNLACWCKLTDGCHADVLLEIANS